MKEKDNFGALLLKMKQEEMQNAFKGLLGSPSLESYIAQGQAVRVAMAQSLASLISPEMVASIHQLTREAHAAIVGAQAFYGELLKPLLTMLEQEAMVMKFMEGEDECLIKQELPTIG
jgi:hypothetical protein